MVMSAIENDGSGNNGNLSEMAAEWRMIASIMAEMKSNGWQRENS
jgi:hypothetical protein